MFIHLMPQTCVSACSTASRFAPLVRGKGKIEVYFLVQNRADEVKHTPNEGGMA